MISYLLIITDSQGSTLTGPYDSFTILKARLREVLKRGRGDLMAKYLKLDGELVVECVRIY